MSNDNCCATGATWKIYKGSEAARTTAITLDGLPFDMTAATVTAQLKDRRTSGTVSNGPVVSCSDVAPSDYSRGVVYVHFDATDTAAIQAGDRAQQLEIKIVTSPVAIDYIVFADVSVYVFETVQG